MPHSSLHCPIPESAHPVLREVAKWTSEHIPTTERHSLNELLPRLAGTSTRDRKTAVRLGLAAADHVASLDDTVEGAAARDLVHLWLSGDRVPKETFTKTWTEVDALGQSLTRSLDDLLEGPGINIAEPVVAAAFDAMRTYAVVAARFALASGIWASTMPLDPHDNEQQTWATIQQAYNAARAAYAAGASKVLYQASETQWASIRAHTSTQPDLDAPSFGQRIGDAVGRQADRARGRADVALLQALLRAIGL